MCSLRGGWAKLVRLIVWRSGRVIGHIKWQRSLGRRLLAGSCEARGEVKKCLWLECGLHSREMKLEVCLQSEGMCTAMRTCPHTFDFENNGNPCVEMMILRSSLIEAVHVRLNEPVTWRTRHAKRQVGGSWAATPVHFRVSKSALGQGEITFSNNAVFVAFRFELDMHLFVASSLK